MWYKLAKDWFDRPNTDLGEHLSLAFNSSFMPLDLMSKDSKKELMLNPLSIYYDQASFDRWNYTSDTGKIPMYNYFFASNKRVYRLDVQAADLNKTVQQGTKGVLKRVFDLEKNWPMTETLLTFMITSPSEAVGDIQAAISKDKPGNDEREPLPLPNPSPSGGLKPDTQPYKEPRVTNFDLVHSKSKKGINK